MQGVGLFLALGPALFSTRLGWVRWLLSFRPMLLVGRWSYSLYLWHSLVLLCVVSVLPNAVWQPAIDSGRLSFGWDLLWVPAIAAIAIALAATSYTYVEMPVVALRRRFGSHAIRDGAAITSAR